MNADLRDDVRKALTDFTSGAPLVPAATGLLNAIGYRSAFTSEPGIVREMLESGPAGSSLTPKQRELLGFWKEVEIVFQFTSDDITRQHQLFEKASFNEGMQESFLFLAVDLKDKKGAYSRTDLAEMTRAANRPFLMPVIVLFRHNSVLTLAAIHRRPHKHDSERDVLKKVTLVKDIHMADPLRAHVDILSDLALLRMMKQEKVKNFNQLHRAWERVLDIETLNKRFYRELFSWFTRAVSACRFPEDGAGEGSNERHVIRLITRLLFVWFLKEKGLVPKTLFEAGFADQVLKPRCPDDTDYYRAILQNLFFATLNTEIAHRAFVQEAGVMPPDFAGYRYRNLLEEPEDLVRVLEQVPFVNGGLFDCLDSFSGTGAEGRILDVFTDDPARKPDLHVPEYLFLDDTDGLFPLFRRYKFTVEENTPLDQEVALDPELLGRAFENLLAAYNPETRENARKATGSYYTPRPVVEYMVGEALVEALAQKVRPVETREEHWRDQLQYLLDWEDANADAGAFFELPEKRAVVHAIAGLRVLDPAVGSGAFPMSVLHRLTLALRRLDPDNTIWEEFQKDRARERAGQAFDTSDQEQRDEDLSEISATFQKYRETDFGRKLYLIQNGIYGADIQPIACQIAKLRFFISLAIEQAPDPQTDNLGIKPLPNLETHFVAADTLIGLRPQSGAKLLEDGAAAKQRAITAVRERYFLADSRARKLECISEEKYLRDELRQLLERDIREWRAAREGEIEYRVSSLRTPGQRASQRRKELKSLTKRQQEYDADIADAQRVAEWDPYDQNGCAGWFAPAQMFGVSGGFDIVIGNPPYVQLQKDGGLLANRYESAGYKTFERTGDVYQLFYERGCGLLKAGTGVLAYITSNSWLKAKYGRSQRRWLAENHTPLRLVEMGKDVFEEAIVDTAVLLARQGGAAGRLAAADLDHLDDGIFPPPDRKWGQARPSGDGPWAIFSDLEWKIFDKMHDRGIPLKDWDISIYYGIKTGLNEAFIVTTDVRNRLIDDDPASENGLEKVS